MADLILPDEGQDKRNRDAAASSLILPPAPDPVASANARAAATTDPERFARAKRLSEQLAIPLPTAERNLVTLDSDRKVRDAQQRMLADPFYADRMRDPEFAKLSQGDEPALSSISKTISSLPWRAAQGVAAGLTAIPAGLAGAFAAPFELASQLVGRPLAGKLLPTDPFAIVGERYRNVSRSISGYSERVADVPKDAGILERGVFSGLQSLGTNLPPMLYAMFTGNVQTALSIISTITGGQSYVKGRDAGLSPIQATQFGATDAAIEYVTEVMPFTKLLGDLKAGAPFVKAFMRNQVGEQLGEQAATVLQDFNEWATLHPEKPFSAYIAERPSAALQTAIATVIGSGGQVAIMHALQTDAQRKEAKANAEAQAVQKLLADAGASLLRERSPATFTQFVAAASANSPVDAVYVNAQTFMQEAQKAGIDVATAMPETALSLEDALQANSDVRISIAELATVLPGTTMEASIIPHLKTDPDGATQAEVSDKAWAEETQKQTEKILAEQAFDDQWTRSIGVVRDDLTAQLTKANRFTRDVNEAYASFMSAFYATQAKRLNITPEEMYARYPLQIRAQGVAGDNVLQQTAQTLNIGLNVGDKKDVLTEGDIRTALERAGVSGAQISFVRGDENTAVVQLPKDFSRDEVAALAAALGQEAIAAAGRSGSFLAGPQAEGWGDFNPSQFYRSDGSTIDSPLGTYAPAHRAALAYAQKSGVTYSPPTTKVKVDPDRAKRIAEAYEAMPHAPNDPGVKAAYEALISETLAQYQEIKATGLNIEFIEAGQTDPYKDSPRGAIDDVKQKNHLWVFPTEQGFGSDATDVTGNPLLVETNEFIGDRRLLANDVFRIVHDYFGHVKDNNGFRANGEENAWRSHSLMYSPLARRAMSTETRGQNSWVNFGPHGDKNRTASAADTVYAPQKTGLLPEWVTTEGAADVDATAGVSVRPQQPDAVAHAGVHYSHAPNLSVLVGARFGTGIKGAERARLAGVRDTNITRRVSLYVADDGKLPRAEFGLGPHVYKVMLTNLYDFANDPRNILSRVPRTGDQNARMNAIEQMVVAEGFDGYANRGQIVVLGADVPVQYVAGSNTLNQDSIPGEWYYSELTRQIEAAKMNEAPARAWKDFIRGLTQKGVKQAEIEATGINEWLDLQAERAERWLIIGPDNTVQRGFSTEENARRATDPDGVNIASKPGYRVEKDSSKVSRAEVLQFLINNGVQVEEQILTEGATDVEYTTSDPETEPPDPDYMRERADERLAEMSVEEVADYLGQSDEYNEDPDSYDEDRARTAARVRMYDEEVSNYYDDPEAPQAAVATIRDRQGFSHDFAVTFSYGDLEIYHPDTGAVIYRGINRGVDVESTIREWAADNLSHNEQSGTEYEGYRTPGGDDYFELKLFLPGKELFSSNHFSDTGGSNLLAHARADIRKGQTGKQLFVDEIQSDWAQAGRDKSTKFKSTTPVDTTGWTATRRLYGHSWWDVENAAGEHVGAAYTNNQADAIRLVSLNTSGTEPAPFVTKTDAWVALVWKRLIRYAAENDITEIVWTRGDQQVERYKGALRKHVDYIEWVKTEQGVQLLGFKTVGGSVLREARVFQGENGLYGVNDPDGREFITPAYNTLREAVAVMRGMPDEVRYKRQAVTRSKVVDTTYKEDQLSDAIGKAMGKQILSDPNQSGVIEGEDITIDSIGMSQFYGDGAGNAGNGKPSILAKVAGDVLKKLGGGKIETFTVDVSDGRTIEMSEQPGFKVTPEMRVKALAGLPLFQGTRGQITFGNDITQQPSVITLLQNADLSTFLHETGHFYLEVLGDMAARDGAPAEIVQDFNTALSWFGVTAEQWRGMSLEERRPHHEKWARGFEAYLFEGKAPSTELQGLFARFRAWFLNVYQQLTALNVVLTPEVRQVMGRLIASNEEILRAESARAFAPLYETRPPGMSEAEWAEYQQLAGDATQEAVDQLQTRSVRDMKYASRAKAAALKRLQREASDKRASVRAEVTAEVHAEPVYQAIHFLRTGETTTPDGEEIKIEKGFKFDKAALAEMYPETALGNPDLEKLSRMTMEGGLHPDLVAEMFGFTSGDHLVRDIADAEPARQKIDGLTDQRMLERYGDLADPDAMERAANEAVHNDVRARFVATELRTLDKAVGQRSVLTKAAKEFAAGMIARKRVRTIRPHIYTAAENKAARAAERALIAGDQRAAATEKRNQLVNLYAAKASHEALGEVDKGVAYLKRAAESDTLDPEYREQIVALLERFDLRRVTARDAARRASLTQWIESQREQNMEPVIDPALELEATRKPYQDMTLEEFRGLVDSVRNIEHLGRLKHKLLQAADQRAFAAIVEDAANTIVENAKRTIPVELERNSWLARTKKTGKQFFAMHRKWTSFWREMDGYKDFGVLQRLFVQTANSAATAEAVMHEQATMRLSELLKPILAEGKMNKKMLIPGTSISLSREGRIMVALNAGNEGNLQRLMDGDHWTPAQVQAIIDTLTKQEMDFVQGVWDFVGGYRAQIAEQQRRLTGVEPEWVEPRKVITPHGVYAGGYIPAKYDTDRSTRSLSDEAAAGLVDAWRAKRGAAQTRAGFTKGRADKVVDRPLRKDFGVITQHVTEVTHRLAWQDWLVDTNRLLRASAIDGAIRDHYGPEVLESLRDAVEDIAAGDVPAQNAFEGLLAFVRKGATIVGLGWRVTTSLLQPLGLTQSMVRIGPKWVGRGLAEWLGDAARMENTVKRINEKSDFMRLRAKTMQREISEIRNKVSGRNSAIEASYFYLIQKMQLVADVPTWLGQYHKAIAGGADETTAVAQADQAVLDAQGGGQIKDLAAIQRGSQGLRLFTNFYSFFNTTFNLTSEAVGRTNFKNPAAIGILAADLLLLYTIPALLGDLMKEALSDDGDDDEDKLVRKLIAGQLSYLFGTMVGVRELAGGARTALGLPGDYGGPASLRVISEVTKLGKQIGQGEADEAFWKALNSTGGILFHYPAGQINNTLDGMISLYKGETANPAALVTGSSK